MPEKINKKETGAHEKVSTFFIIIVEKQDRLGYTE